MEGSYLSVAVVATTKELRLQTSAATKSIFVSANAPTQLRKCSLKQEFVSVAAAKWKIDIYPLLSLPQLVRCNCRIMLLQRSHL